MEFGTSLVAGPEPFELEQPGEGAFDHPAHLAQSGAVDDAASSDHGFDAVLPQQEAVLVEVVAPDRQDGIEQWHKLGDVVPVAAG